MGNLTKAQKILTNLELHLKKYVVSAKTVDSEMTYAIKHLAEAEKLRKESVHTQKKETDPRFEILTKLEDSVKKLMQTLHDYKTKLEEQKARALEEQKTRELEEQKAKKLEEQKAAAERDKLSEATQTEDESLYAKELAKLEHLVSQKHPESLDPFLTQFLEHIKELKAGGKECDSDLVSVLSTTYLRLTNQLTVKEYECFAHTVQGKPSTGLKVLGGLMLALSIAVLAIGAFFIPEIIAVGAVAALVGTAGVSLASGIAAVGLFAKGRQTGLSKELTNLNEQLEENKFSFSTF